MELPLRIFRDHALGRRKANDVVERREDHQRQPPRPAPEAKCERAGEHRAQPAARSQPAAIIGQTADQDAEDQPSEDAWNVEHGCLLRIVAETSVYDSIETVYPKRKRRKERIGVIYPLMCSLLRVFGM